jgi:hypothetical protein
MLVCPSCATGHEDGERFCEHCGVPLVEADAGRDGVMPPESERHERARKIRPQYAEGPLVKVVGARNQSEAELLQGMLLEEGVPSMVRRSGGFDVPDFLAAGPRDILVPASGADAAREVLQLPDPQPGIGMLPGEGTPAWVKALAVALTVVILAIIAAGVYAAVF